MTDSSHDAQMQVPAVQVALKTVNEFRSKFEVGHKRRRHRKLPMRGTVWTSISGETNMSLKPNRKDRSTLGTRRRELTCTENG